jgi:hypothetical protein
MYSRRETEPENSSVSMTLKPKDTSCLVIDSKNGYLHRVY